MDAVLKFLMAIWTYFAQNILQQPAFMIGLIVLVGYLLEKKKWYEISLTEIIGKIEMTKDGFPKQLPLEEQGKFMLGYYHQIQKKYEKKEDK